MDQTLEKLRALSEGAVVDLTNTEIAFAAKSDKELQKMAWIFGLMNKHWLVGIGSTIGLAAIRMRLPFVKEIVKHTIFEQFCGGTSLENAVPTIEKLHRFGVETVLDYGVEAKEDEEDFDRTMEENLRALKFAIDHESVNVVSTKLTGLARFGLLEKLNGMIPAEGPDKEEWDRAVARVDRLARTAAENDVQLYIDAEETWIQNSIDLMVRMMMARYNGEKAIVFNTFQLYRKDHLQHLKNSLEEARTKGFVLGAKLVRGAYMEKERERAEEMGYPSPIQDDKEASDRDYNAAVRFCVENYREMASCNATHNAESSLLQARLMEEMGIERDHPHLRFSQLYGMSDNISFNLAEAGFNVAKYLPYGSVRDVVPYLIRRAQENSSVTGDMSREYRLVHEEVVRRGLA